MAVYNVTSPTGEKYRITAPEDATPEQIHDYATQNFGNAPSSPDFADRMSADFAKRGQQINDAQQITSTNPQSSALQTLSAGVGMVNDTLGNVAGSGARSWWETQPPGVQDALKQLYINPMKQAAGAFAGGAQQVGQAAASAMPQAGEAMAQGSDYAKQLMQNNPIATKDVGAIANIATSLPAGKVLKEGLPVTGEALEAVGNQLQASGAKTIARKDMEAVKNLVMPLENKKVLEDQVSRTDIKGINARKIVTPTPIEQAAIEEVSKIPEVKSGNTYQENWNIINDTKNTEAVALNDKLKNVPLKYDVDVFKGKLDSALTALKQDPLIVGDAETTATRVIDKMKSLIDKNPNTPSGLLAARQQFDSWAKMKKVKVFDANETAFSTAVRDARSAANQHIAELVPTADVAASLKKQSNLYTALDNIREKAAGEAPTRLSRLADKISDTKAGRHPLIAVSALGGLGTALGFTGLAGPAAGAVGAGIAGEGLRRAVLSGTARKGIGKVLSTTGKIIKGI